MISLLLSAYIIGSGGGISNTTKLLSMKPIGQGVLFPEIHHGMLILDTNVFVYDSNRNVVTLRDGIGAGHFYPITDNQYEIVRPKIITKIHEFWYVKLNLVIGILVGAALGSWFGIRSGFKKGTR